MTPTRASARVGSTAGTARKVRGKGVLAELGAQNLELQGVQIWGRELLWGGAEEGCHVGVHRWPGAPVGVVCVQGTGRGAPVGLGGWQWGEALEPRGGARRQHPGQRQLAFLHSTAHHAVVHHAVSTGEAPH